MGWRQRIAYYGYRYGAEIAAATPRVVAEPLAQVAGRAFALTMGERRRLVARNLDRVAGRTGDDRQRRSGPLARNRAVARTFQGYARYWLDSFRLPHLSDDDVLALADADPAGMEHLAAATAGGRGAIFALPHFGSWEMAGRWVTLQGYRLTAVVEPLEPPELFEWFRDLRRSIGIDVVALGDDVLGVLRGALDEGRVVCLVADRDLSGNGVEVDFFGERTRLPAGPAMLALRHGVEILPVATFARPHGRQYSVIHPPLDRSRRGSLRDDVTRITQELAHVFETIIRQAPEQWHLMQPNWPSDLGNGR
jgi:phosphatidylinositol dimannoside acyltransferase